MWLRAFCQPLKLSMTAQRSHGGSTQPHEQPTSKTRCSEQDGSLRSAHKLLARMGSSSTQACWCGSMQDQHARIGSMPSCGVTREHNDMSYVRTETECLGQGQHATAWTSIASAASLVRCVHPACT